MSKQQQEQKLPTDKKSSLERLQNQLYQAQASGDTALARKIKAIIERIRSLQ
jgi:hypothetical protein